MSSQNPSFLVTGIFFKQLIKCIRRILEFGLAYTDVGFCDQVSGGLFVLDVLKSDICSAKDIS
jgi:hypothetical protein